MPTLVPVDAPTEPDLHPLLTVSQLARTLGLSRSWIYRRTGPKAIDPIPVVRFGKRSVRFNPDHVLLCIRARERLPISDKMGPSDGIARVNGKGFKLTRKRFQTGTVRLREDRDPVWWEAFYRENVIRESGGVKRIRRSVKLGLLKDIPSEAQAKRRLAQILVNINSDGYRPKSVIAFRASIRIGPHMVA